MYEIFEKLCNERGITPYRFCKDTGINSSTISTWKNKGSECSPKTAKAVCDYFGVSMDYLMTGADGEILIEVNQLNSRDRKDIGRIITYAEKLLSQDGLMFDGKPASPEAVESILSAMQIGMEMAKKKNKELYTPKKYKKDK